MTSRASARHHLLDQCFPPLKATEACDFKAVVLRAPRFFSQANNIRPTTSGQQPSQQPAQQPRKGVRNTTQHPNANETWVICCSATDPQVTKFHFGSLLGARGHSNLVSRPPAGTPWPHGTPGTPKPPRPTGLADRSVATPPPHISHDVVWVAILAQVRT